MDVESATREPALPTSIADLAASVKHLQDREAVRNLIACYSILRDDSDIESLVSLFTTSGSFQVGQDRHVGHQGLRDFYMSNVDKYRTSLHVTHTQVLELANGSGTGVVTGHAELAFEGHLMIAAYRYQDQYAVQDGIWRFAERILRFMYVVPFEEMATSFRDELRIRWPGSPPSEAEIPEGIASYQRMRSRHRGRT